MKITKSTTYALIPFDAVKKFFFFHHKSHPYLLKKYFIYFVKKHPYITIDIHQHDPTHETDPIETYTIRPNSQAFHNH